MRNLTTCLLILGTVGILTVSLRGTESDTGAPASTLASDRFLITLSEYRIVGAASPELSEREIYAMIASRKVAPVETIRVSVVGGVEGMAQFGKQVTVTTGKMVSREGGVNRVTKDVPLGTILRVTAKMHGADVMASIQYESTRHDGEGTDDSPPELATNRITTTQIIPLATPTLLGGTSADASSYLVVTVSRLTASAK